MLRFLRKAALLGPCFALIAAVTVSTAHAASNQHPQCSDLGSCHRERGLDSVWLVSTRHLGCACAHDMSIPDYQIMRHNPCEGWDDASLEDFLAAGDPDVETIVFVHGNRVDWCKALQLGLHAYRVLVRCAHQPVRFVIWSWPSDKMGGLLRDVRVKGARTNTDSYYLARFIQQIPHDASIGLVGFSYGGRIVSGTAHISAGGSLCGMGLPDGEHCPPRRIRAVLMAAAMHNYWLCPESYHGHAIESLDHLLVLFNPCDHALKWYPLIDKSRPHALGAAGFCWEACWEHSPSVIEQRNVCGIVGNSHKVNDYFSSCAIMREVRRVALRQRGMAASTDSD
jgi:hypothetical protein